jgi:CheY-like chemotaxis protein
MMSTGLLLSDDLLFKSRIIGTAKSLGLEIVAVSNADDLLAKAQAEKPACVLIDLQNPGLDIGAFLADLKAMGNPNLVAYGSHVDTARLKAARDAGCNVVLPRSTFVEGLATDLPKWFGTSSE